MFKYNIINALATVVFHFILQLYWNLMIKLVIAELIEYHIVIVNYFFSIQNYFLIKFITECGLTI